MELTFHFDFFNLFEKSLDLSKAKILACFEDFGIDLAIDDPIIPNPIINIFLNIKPITNFCCLFHFIEVTNSHTHMFR